MIKYTLYTENKNIKSIKGILNLFYQGYTIINTLGYWQGKKEKSLKIEVITEKTEKDLIYNKIALNCIIETIKKINNQQTILLTTESIKADFL